MSAVKAIYAGVRALGMDAEDDRRDFFVRVTGKRRLREMTPADKERVVAELRRMGFRPAIRRELDGPYAKKLQALWIAAWNLGLTRSRDDKALVAFVKRQTGLDHTRWLHDPKQADRVIEALKGWIGREAGVMWGNTNGHDFLRDHGAKIAWAQWARLHPASSLLDLGPFRSRVGLILRDPKPLDRLTSADWRQVCNTLGTELRKGRA